MMDDLYFYLLALIMLAFVAASLIRRTAINSFKIEYYETKLKNIGVDISHVENIGFLDILRL